MMMVVMIIVSPVIGKPLRQLRVLFDQQLGRPHRRMKIGFAWNQTFEYA